MPLTLRYVVASVLFLHDFESPDCLPFGLLWLLIFVVFVVVDVVLQEVTSIVVLSERFGRYCTSAIVV